MHFSFPQHFCMIVLLTLHVPRMLFSEELPHQEMRREIESLRSRLDRYERLLEINSVEDPSAAERGNSVFRAGYSDGLSLEFDGAEYGSFLLKNNYWFQLRNTWFQSENANPDELDFELERARIVFSGHAVSEDLKYFVQLDGDSDDEQSLDVLDYYLLWRFPREYTPSGQNYVQIRAGQWKLPFNRARHEESGKKLSFSDRALVSVIFDINRSIGLGLEGEWDSAVGPFGWELALFNGFRTGGFRASRSGELDDNLAGAGRLVWDLLGEWDEGEPDLAYQENPAVRLGGGFAFTSVHREGLREFNRIITIDSGEPLSSLLPLGVDEYSVVLMTADLGVKWRGWSLYLDYYFRQLYDISPIPALTDQGVLIQTSYFIVPKKLEVMVRWGGIFGESSSLGADTRSTDEVGAGIAWYLRGQNLKLGVDASHINGSPATDRTLNYLRGDEGWLVRTQLQFAF